MKIDPYLSLFTKLKFPWIKDLNIKPDTINLIEEKVGKVLELLRMAGNILNKSSMTQVLRSIIDERDLIKLKSFYKEHS